MVCMIGDFYDSNVVHNSGNAKSKQGDKIFLRGNNILIRINKYRLKSITQY